MSKPVFEYNIMNTQPYNKYQINPPTPIKHTLSGGGGGGGGGKVGGCAIFVNLSKITEKILMKICEN